jgi:two-component system NarL family response regulator
MPTERIRVLCVDDHPIVRDGISLVIGRQQDMEVVAAAATGEEGVTLFRSLHPDVTLMDLQLRSMSGLEAIRVIRGENELARIIVLTTYEGDEDIYRSLEAGAVTYLLKDTLSNDLVRVIRKVHEGRQPMDVEIEARLRERAAGRPLSPREVQVTELIARGMRNKEIAASLDISEDTVQAHIKSMFSKLRVHDRTAAMDVALRRGIIHLKPR